MSIYMCGHLGIGDTRYHDVPFVPSQDCANWESCQEEAYRKGREDQGELNTDTVREIRELVYQQGIEKGIDELVNNLIDEWTIESLVSEDDAKTIRGIILSRAEQLKGVKE